jgi:signal transduction histidine kinase
MTSANFFIPQNNVGFNLLAIGIFLLSTFFLLRIQTGYWILFAVELLVSLALGWVYIYTDFPYPLLVGLVGLGIFLFYHKKSFVAFWCVLFMGLIVVELIFQLHPVLQIIINYSFVIFASVTGGLIRYSYQMKNRTQTLYQELEHSYQKLREHASTVEQLAVQEERNRIAREIHDTVGHTVTALIFQLEAAQKLFSIDQQKSMSMVKTSEELARSIYREIRFSIEATDLSDWEGVDLHARLEKLVQTFSHLTGLEVFYHADGDFPSSVPRKYTFGLYRILQETLTNAKRHGKADKVWVTIRFLDKQLELNINDDGIGCDQLQIGFGLKNLQNRVKELHGKCSFSTKKGNGFKTRVVIPFDQEREVVE